MYANCGEGTARMIAGLEELLRRHVESGDVPGAVVLIDRGTPRIVAVGSDAVGGRALEGDEIFRIQSMTKAITAVAALRLVEAGRLGLDAGLEEWLPELVDRRVLSSPTAELSDTVAAVRSITLRHLLTNGSGYGAVMVESALQSAMVANGTAGGSEPPSVGADEWLRLLADLPLAFQPGEGWRYHHSFGILGILLSRVTGEPLGEFLMRDLFEPLGMHDTGFFVRADKLGRLPAAYRHDCNSLVETERAGAGFFASAPPFDVSHEELVSNASDYHRFLRLLTGHGEVDGRRLMTAHHVEMLTTDQVRAANKTPDSFFPGFWDGMGWGFGVAVHVEGLQRGRYGWSGGLGTDFFVDPDGAIGILMTQVEIGEETMALLDDFQALA